MTSIETSEVPAHVVTLARDPDVFAAYVEASEMSGTDDIVVCFNPSEPDDLYAGPRESLLTGLLQEQADNPLTPGVLDNLKSPASLKTGLPNSFWVLVSDNVGVHCVAVVAASKSSTNS